ncbi:MLO-like protein 4 isoform X1 [Malania oleifera]|uniref:MLO-like protein 4 isoform X1 n=1 Tax=Malania oleifera TaxID=397392 RepID=UPI0025ADE1DC|nr:MLO-like protein 4 isoform X1 [Malania oleifera]
MEDEGWEGGGASLEETPSFAVASVVSVMLAFGFLIHGALKQFGKWLDRTKRRSLLAALDKIKEELMLFGLLSLMMGHWTVFVAKICIKSSAFSSRFYPCAVESDVSSVQHVYVSRSNYFNTSVYRDQQLNAVRHDYCPEGYESFASYESLEQLHRFVFVLGVTHISYSFAAIALAMIKIYSWRTWENQAKSLAAQSSQGSPKALSNSKRMRRLSTFIFHHTSHPWSQHRVLVWLLCFSRQFWSSINRADYMALRLGFITTHELPLSYDFHNYMLRSMEEEFRDIVGISIPLWIYGISCIFLDFHGSNIYFWVSFIPAILILLIGTKLHRIVVKLAVEIMDTGPWMENRNFNLRDELFWLGRPRLLLWLIQLISFLNAFEMATFIWSVWEVRGPSCFMDNSSFLVIRLTFGVVSQFWCSFITFPLYIIVTQMGSRFRKSVISKDVRKSLHGWQMRAKARHGSSSARMSATSTTSLKSPSACTSMTSTSCFKPLINETNNIDNPVFRSLELRSSIYEDNSSPLESVYAKEDRTYKPSQSDRKLSVSLTSAPIFDSYDSYDDDEEIECENGPDASNNEKDSSCLLRPT